MTGVQTCALPIYLARRGLSLPALAADPLVREYLGLQQQVLTMVRMESGSETLVDTSKAGPRAWLVATDPGSLLLHLHRDAVDVLASWRQPKWDPALNAPMHKPSIAAAALDWWKAERWAALLARRRSVQRIDYPIFADSPRVALQGALDRDAPGLVDSLGWQGERQIRPGAE